MRDNFVASEILEPYAKAMMSLAQAHDLTDRFGDDINFLLQLLNESSELKELLANPLIVADVKKAVLRQIAGETVHPFVVNFLMLLADRRRIFFLEGICKQYQVLLRELRQITLAEVVSAVELSDAQKDSIRQKVIDMTGARQVELDAQVDPDLIGGVIIKVGSQVIDASLKGQLRRIGLRLASTT